MSVLHDFLGGMLKPVLTYASRGRLPQIEGRIELPALHGEVLVYRDEWGIPHIQAERRDDLYFVQGYVHAGDRLWQMEVNRRVATGRLAELFGPVALDTDRLTRTLGFARLGQQAWDQAAEQTKADLIAYAAGVNSYIEREAAPIEFSLLRHTPEPWQPVDTYAFALLQSWALCSGWNSELTRAQLSEALDADLLSELEPHYPAANPSTLPRGVEFNRLEIDGKFRAAIGPFLGKGSLDGGGRGSNAWAVSAARSATGKTILCNDMHLPMSSPGLWYFAHQQCADGLHVAGVTIPGAPYVLVGHNERIAWGATLTFSDSEDLFVEKLSDDGTQYLFADQWRPLQQIPERIIVKGREPHIETVRLSHHGPLISAALGKVESRETALSLCSIALRPHQALEAFCRLDYAAGWDDFVAAVRLFDAPTLNLVYADVGDNIGYYFTGDIPIRAEGNGATPAPGWTGDHEWTRFVPFAEKPHALNPERGYIISCNHRIVPDDYPYFLGNMWMTGFRARRLEELFSSREQVSLEDCRRFQFDFHSIPGLQLVGKLSELEPDLPDAVLALELLRGWDGWLGAGSVGGAVYELFLARLADVILTNGLGPELSKSALGLGAHPLLAKTSEYFGYWPITVMRMLDNPDSGWLPGAVGREAVLVRCLAEAIQEIRELLGERPASWEWGRLHGINFDHVLAAQPPLDRVFSQGPFPIGGDSDTVLQTSTRPDAGYQNNNVSPSYRQIVDLGDLRRSQAMHAPGQSGHLGSPHYGDMIQPWLNGGYFAMSWDWAEIARNCRYRQTFASADH